MVDLRSGDATEIVAGLPGPFDYVFFDADRFSAPAQLSLLIPKLTPDVLLLADNVLSHPNEIAAIRAGHCPHRQGIECGIQISCRLLNHS